MKTPEDIKRLAWKIYFETGTTKCLGFYSPTAKPDPHQKVALDEIEAILTNLISQVQQDGKDEWIERCANACEAERIFDPQDRKQLGENIGITNCKQAILSLKTEHPEKGNG